ncbi:MAG: hypothetical protein LBP35_00180 [Candidatus Ancillula trichonymphae]|jgi:hypothetical protein|nr:hypothetical protein [Candidatus Ancillula trichonymphae]
MEVFSQQITSITDQVELYAVRRALESQNIYNVAKLTGHTDVMADVMDKLDFKKLAKLLTEVSNRAFTCSISRMLSKMAQRVVNC